MTIQDLAVGDTCNILGYEESGRSYRKRLLAMGLTPGTEFKVTRFAPMGDPIQISIRGFALTLRKAEASVVIVELIKKCNKGCC
jgi:ferrous iron transport protein A